MNGTEIINEAPHFHISGQWLFWAVTGGISLIFVVLWFWVKRWINQMDLERDGWREKGGVLTRDAFFKFCHDARAQCPACEHIKELQIWRNEAQQDGGPMLRLEHTEICKEITKELTNHFTERIKELFENHRVWVAQELKLITREQESLSKLVKEQIKTESGRWEGHDEQTRLQKK